MSPQGIRLDQGAQASLAGHRLQGLHAVEPLQQARHEGLLEAGLLLPRAAAHSNQSVQDDHADAADDERGNRHLPGYGDRKEHIDQKNKPTGHGVAGLDIGHGRAQRLDADRRRKVARALIHEMPPARSQKCSNHPETKPHRHMRRGVAYLGHGRHHQ